MEEFVNFEPWFLSSSVLLYFLQSRSPRQYTAHPSNRLRPKFGEYTTTFLLFKADEDEQKFFDYMRMTKNTFNYILQHIAENNTKRYRNCHGRPIFIEQRLVVTIQYLATGRSFRGLGGTFRMHHTTVSQIVHETTRILWDTFSLIHMPTPTAEDFKNIASQFHNLWNFPNLAGCIDGKHIRIKNVPHSGGRFFNYKHYFSFVLQGLVDANYKFICIDVGNFGRQSDGGTFRYSALYQCLESGRLQLPKEDTVPEGDMKLPYVIIGDDAYPLMPYLIKPYSGESLTERQQHYNNRVSRARRCVEHAFGIITAKWRLLKKDIECDIELAISAVKTICLFHNILIDREGMTHTLNPVIPVTRHTKKRGTGLAGRPKDEAKEVRDAFCEYFDRHRIIWNNKSTALIDSDSYDDESDIDDPGTPE